MQVTIYTTTTCPYCKMLKDYLTQKQIPFTEKLVDQDETAKVEMSTKSDGYLGVPYTIVIKDGGEEIKIVGFDKTLFDKSLGLVQ